MNAPDRPAIIIAATPTPNGDLHVGHMAGPYLAADIYARQLRADGVRTTYTTVTDNSQSYVVTTAVRQGLSPQELCDRSTTEIEQSLTALGIELTAPAGRVLPPVDDHYRAAVTSFIRALRDAGRLRARTVRLPYAEKSGLYLYDGLLIGRCPACDASSGGGACEDCGHPNNFDELLDPRYALDPEEPVTFREERVLVLPMEEYRAELTAHLDSVAGRWRPHPLRLVRELLARPLPDIPVTFPGTWGVPAPFEDFAGQIVYPWAEAMPASMYATWWAHGGPADLPYDEFWKAGRDAELVYFHGFDNVYHWAVMDLVLLLAHGDRYVRPTAGVCNEFYELEHAKFSTSRNHLIRAGDLVADAPRDIARYYLALTAPERARTNFDPAELAARPLAGTWNELAGVVDASLAGRDFQELLPVTEEGRRANGEFARQLRACFALETFSLARAARLIADRAAELLGTAAEFATAGDFLLAVRTLLAWSAPILVDVGRQAAEDGVDLALSGVRTAAVEKIAPFRLPRLPERALTDG
ncbi:class I tRNA ligase family protein [Streptomyces olivoreticuli]